MMVGKPEPGLRAFSEWLDHQMRRSPDTRGGILGAILGTSWGLCGALVGILAGGLQLPPSIALSPLLLGLVATGVGLRWYVRSRSEEDRAFARLHAETRGVVWRLQTMRWRGQLRLDEPVRERLEAGASHWLRAREAFRSPLWNAAGPDSAHVQARDNAEKAMETAMARLVLMLGAGGYSESLAQSADGLIADMRQTADEAQQLVGQFGERTDRFVGDPSKDLRAALGELKMLTQAEREVRELHQGDEGPG